MRVKSKFKAEPSMLKRKWSEKKDGMVGDFELLVPLTESRARQIFGGIGARYYGALKTRPEGAAGGDDSSPESIIKTASPSKVVVFEEHDIVVEGCSFKAQPKLLKGIDIPNSDKVYLMLRFPVNLVAFGKLGKLGGSSFDIEMKPTQPEKQTLNLVEKE